MISGREEGEGGDINIGGVLHNGVAAGIRLKNGGVS